MTGFIPLEKQEVRYMLIYPCFSSEGVKESDITIEKSTGSPDLSRTKPVIKLGRGRPKNERLSQYPSIRLVHLSNLQVLASASPNPSQEVIKIWADLTGSDPIDVANWVRNYHPSQEETDYRATTDQDFLDVEDVEEEVSEEEEEEKEEPLSQKSASQINPAPYRNLAHYPPPSPQPVDSGVQLSPQENLLLAISKSLSLSSEEPPLPRSSLQFNDLFAPYETMMKYLIENQDWQS